MTFKNREEVKRWLKNALLIQKELRCRAEHLRQFKTEMCEPLKLASDDSAQETLRGIYQDIVADMEMEMLKLKKQLRRIERVLRKLDGRERAVLYERYIRGTPWVDMAERINYEQRTCQYIEKSALDKILKMRIR